MTVMSTHLGPGVNEEQRRHEEHGPARREIGRDMCVSCLLCCFHTWHGHQYPAAGRLRVDSYRYALPPIQSLLHSTTKPPTGHHSPTGCSGLGPKPHATPCLRQGISRIGVIQAGAVSAGIHGLPEEVKVTVTLGSAQATLSSNICKHQLLYQ